MQVEHEVAQADPVEPADDGVDGRALLGDEQHPLAVGRQGGDEVGDGLRLAGAGRAVHDEVRPRAHRLDGLLLAAVGVEHEHVALGVVEVDPAAVELGAHRAQGVGVAGERGHDVVVGEGVALGGEVGHHRQLGVREGADDQPRGDREVGDVRAGGTQGGVDRVGVEHGVGGGQRLEGVLVEGDALLGRR